ncbi:MAG TPA: TolC family protein [Desulfosarcina sp.]|nr:TolC family protein [Desulfosarcina sp.]
MRTICILIGIMMIRSIGLAAEPLTIDMAVREALQNNPRIHEAQAYREAAVFGEKEARADFLPRFSAAYSYQNLAEPPFVNIYGNQVITNSRDQHHWEAAVTQPLFAGFGILSRHRLAELGLKSRELELKQARQTLILQVKRRCFDLLMAQKNLVVAQSSEKALTAHEADARRFYQNGLAPLNDLLKAQVARADATQQRHRAEAAVINVRSALNLLLGREYGGALEIADVDPYTPVATPLNAQVAKALEARPDVDLLEQAILSKETERQLAESDFYPRIDLLGKYQQDGDDLGAENNDYTNQYNASVGVQAHWTFFEFGKTRLRSAKVGSERRALEQALDNIQDDVRLQVVQARLDLDVAARNIDTARTALDQALEHWRITNLLYQQRLTTSTEVLDARSYLDRAQSAFLEARYGYGSALARLEWATGGTP